MPKWKIVKKNGIFELRVRYLGVLYCTITRFDTYEEAYRALTMLS